MNSWCGSMYFHVTCRSRRLLICGNQRRTLAAHSASPIGGPPGVSPSAIAGARYLRIVLRSTARLWAISYWERPAYQ
ncbi:hypothetical protein DQ384_31115 [Sphaerisporangium album]|uniref:Uncharacterized protein n=1 Tax=Sphaerisporangium album TaxID=509200 RepID=A0A367F4P5_9ACTN|nr:hypothetical protein DQ384_31115 [Sphaerisporangium album]